MNQTYTGNESPKTIDNLLMQEALAYYDENPSIKQACDVFGISRYMYAHEYCLSRYRAKIPTVITSDTTIVKIR